MFLEKDLCSSLCEILLQLLQEVFGGIIFCKYHAHTDSAGFDPFHTKKLGAGWHCGRASDFESEVLGLFHTGGTVLYP